MQPISFVLSLEMNLTHIVLMPSTLSDFMKQRLLTDATWRTAFCEMFHCVVACLAADCIPSKERMVYMLKENTIELYSIRIPHEDSVAMALKYLEMGGRFSDVLRVAYCAEKLDSEDVSNSMYEQVIKDMDKCRNDFEWCVVATLFGIDDYDVSQ